MQNPTNWKKEKTSGPELSDISDDEEDEPMLVTETPEAGLLTSSSTGGKRNRIFWTTEKEDYLLRVFNYYRRTSSGGHGLKGKSWRFIGVHMTRRYQEDFDSKSCRNKLNVLKYDYMEVKSMADARRNGTDTDAFWTEMQDRYPRALKWKDTPYPHSELLKIILEENGEGLEVMPEILEPVTLPAETRTPRSKRPRSLAGLSTMFGSNMREYVESVGQLPEPSPAVNSHALVSAAAAVQSNTDKIFTDISMAFDEHLDQVLTAIRAIPVPTLDELPGFAMRRRCMEELSKDQFSKVMHDHQQRDCAFELLKDPAVVNDFLLYPQDYRHLFLEDIVLKALNLK